jgi:hypothetical protein
MLRSALMVGVALGLVTALSAQVAAFEMTPPRVDSGSFVDSIAQTAYYFGIDEVRLGPALSNMELLPNLYVVPDVSSFNKARLDAAQFDIYFRSPEIFRWIGSPRPSIGGIVNFSGHESFVHGGIDYHVPLGTSPFYVEVGGGVGIHNGYLDNAPAGYHDLGCPVLLHWKAGLGANLNADTTLTLDWEHMSNIVFRCHPNQGLNAIGLVIGHKF